jgi:hypothetical protein
MQIEFLLGFGESGDEVIFGGGSDSKVLIFPEDKGVGFGL